MALSSELDRYMQGGKKKFILPKENSKEAAVVKEAEVYAPENLREVVDFINKKIEHSESALPDTYVTACVWTGCTRYKIAAINDNK